MQFTFEFECPEFTKFSKKHAQQSFHFQLDSSNPNDRWFMTLHEKEINQSDRISDPKPGQEGPVVRASLMSKHENQQHTQSKDLEQQTLDQGKRAQNLPPNNSLLFKNQPKRRGNLRTNILARGNRKEHISNLQNTKNSKNTSKIKKQGPSTVVTRSKSKFEPRNKSKDRWPCPFSTKLQREWEHNHGVKWYDLSPKSKDQAARSMKTRQLQQKYQDYQRVDIKQSKQK